MGSGVGSEVGLGVGSEVGTRVRGLLVVGEEDEGAAVGELVGSLVSPAVVGSRVVGLRVGSAVLGFAVTGDAVGLRLQDPGLGRQSLKLRWNGFPRHTLISRHSVHGSQQLLSPWPSSPTQHEPVATHWLCSVGAGVVGLEAGARVVGDLVGASVGQRS